MRRESPRATAAILSCGLLLSGCGFFLPLPDNLDRGPFYDLSDGQVAAMLRSRSASKRERVAREFAVSRKHYADCLPALGAACSDRDERVRIWASTAVWKAGDSGEPVPESVVGGLQASDVETRQAAVEALAEFGEHGRSQVPLLIDLLRTGDRKLRWAACSSLPRVDTQSADAVAALVTATGDPDVGSLAIVELGKVRGAAAIETLNRLSTGSDARLAARAVTALGEQPSDEVRVDRPLRAALRSGPLEVRTAAAWALCKRNLHDPEAIPELIELLRAGAGDPVEAILGRVGAPAVPAVVPLLESTEPKVRLGALKALSECALQKTPIPDAVIDRILRMGDDRNEEVRRERLALLLFSRPDLSATLEAVREGKRDRDRWVRYQAEEGEKQVRAHRDAVPGTRESSQEGAGER